MGKKSRRKKTGGEGGDSGGNLQDAFRTGLQKSIRREQKKSIDESRAILDTLSSHPLPVQISTIRRVLQTTGTNVEENDADPAGDGDQSLIRTDDGREAARTLFSIGGDIHSHFEQGAVSRFATLCVMGDAKGVEQILSHVAASDPGPPSRNSPLVQMLETRETSLRLSPLLLVVSAAKNLSAESGEPMEHRRVAQILLKYGARPHAKDVVGKTVCHYGAGMMATRMTLDVTDMCIRAANTAHLFGKEVELFGLNNAAINGQRGVVGGYLIENDRRAVFLFSKGKEVAINPANLRPVGTGEDSDHKLPMLADIPDRMGAVSLLEVIMVDRADVAEFLLNTHHASIDVEDLDGMTPIKMATSASQVGNTACALVQKRARKQSNKERKEKKRQCSHCGAREGEENPLRTCVACSCVQYCNALCQTRHWEETHKVDCKVLQGIKLEKPVELAGMHHAFVSVSVNPGRPSTGGSYRKPDNVEYGERFTVKVQAGGDITPLMIYDESRQCEFMLVSGRSGFKEVLQATRSQTAFQGRKCFMKASFDEKGTCTVYPGTANVKHSW